MKLLVVALVAALAFYADAQVGFAGQNGGTTGGAGGEEVTVSNEADLIDAVAGNDARIVKINGLITLSDWARVGSNKSILGASSSSGITGAGFYVKDCSNVIIQGLKISKAVAPFDGISIESATNIWVDHNELFSDLSHDKDYYDGLCDAKHASDFITVSWNHFHDHYKVSLIGHSDDNGGEDEGHLRITYVGNWFADTGSRLPSLRFGTGHIFNNFFENAESSGVNSRMGAQVLVENNVFRNVHVPLTTDLDSDEQGYAVERGNIFEDEEPNITQEGSFTNPPYSYSAIPASDVEGTVKNEAGNARFYK